MDVPSSTSQDCSKPSTHASIITSPKTPATLCQRPFAKRLSVTVVDWFKHRPSHSPQTYQMAWQRSRPSSWNYHVLSHVATLLWLLPVVTILTLNFKPYIIGSSVWCIEGGCNANLLLPTMVVRALKLDQHDHEMLGVLQFLAKALEIWFAISAALLVHDIIMIIARTDGGVPLRFLTLHTEFRDIRYFLSHQFWKAPFTSENSRVSQQKSKSLTTSFIVVLLIPFISIVTLLMDPALAILMLPSQKWVNTEIVSQEIFHDFTLGLSPEAGRHALRGCSGVQLHANNYSCTEEIYGPNLDAMAAWTKASFVNSDFSYSDGIVTTLQEDLISFSFNTTGNEPVIWIPNRQVLHSISNDFVSLMATEHHGEEPKDLIDSLELVYARHGPSIGISSTVHLGSMTITQIDHDREILCFDQWMTEDSPSYTKCFRIGTGFNSASSRSSFSIENSADGISKSSVDVFFSDCATYFNEETDFGTGIRSCLENTAERNCDWNQIFDSKKLPEALRKFAHNMNIVSYGIPQVDVNTADEFGTHDNKPAEQPLSQSRIWGETSTQANLAIYSLPISPDNILNMIQLEMSTAPNSMTESDMIVHPDWTLASWSVDRDGVVPYTRPIARQVTKALSLAWESSLSTMSPHVIHERITDLHVSIVGQAMSMADYTASRTVNNAFSPHTTVEDLIDPSIFGAWYARRVWVYDVRHSGISRAAAVIVFLGIALILLRCTLGILAPRKTLSPTQILTSALRSEGNDQRQGSVQLDKQPDNTDDSYYNNKRYILCEESEAEDVIDVKGRQADRRTHTTQPHLRKTYTKLSAVAT